LKKTSQPTKPYRFHVSIPGRLNTLLMWQNLGTLHYLNQICSKVIE